MEETMYGRCGAECAVCEWRETTDCPGCLAAEGAIFWGECEVAGCCMEKGLDHCGLCGDVPCAALQSFFDDPEHGDDGERLENLRAWAQKGGEKEKGGR